MGFNIFIMCYGGMIRAGILALGYMGYSLPLATIMAIIYINLTTLYSLIIVSFAPLKGECTTCMPCCCPQRRKWPARTWMWWPGPFSPPLCNLFVIGGGAAERSGLNCISIAQR